jgi:hypothetical protein
MRNKLLSILVVCLLACSFAFSAGSKKLLPTNSGAHTSFVSFTQVNSYVDTIIYNVEPGLASLTFWLYSPDSVSLTRISLRRVSTIAGGNTVNTAVATIDTLSLFSSLNPNSTASGAATVQAQAVTLSPVPDQIWFIILHASTENGVTSTTAYAGVNKTYYKKP